jgi:hypothetical protein
MDVIDWYMEGRRWYDRSQSHQGYNLYGPHGLTHLRALLKLTSDTQQYLAAQDGWRRRQREVANMPFDEMDDYFESMRSARF